MRAAAKATPRSRSAPAAPIKVLVVDDQRTFAEALAIALGHDGGLAVRAAATGSDAVQMAAQERPDVALVDVEMPASVGLETIRRILELHPGARVIAVSAFDQDLPKARALEAGASGHLSKRTTMADVRGLIRRAHEGEVLIDPQEVSRLGRYLRHRRHQESTERQRANRLTPRQIEILQLLSDGVPMAGVAERLGMTTSTLRTHTQNILTRLGVHTKLEAVAVAIRHGRVSVGG